jgi:hypothetical protein
MTRSWCSFTAVGQKLMCICMAAKWAVGMMPTMRSYCTPTHLHIQGGWSGALVLGFSKFAHSCICDLSIASRVLLRTHVTQLCARETCLHPLLQSGAQLTSGMCAQRRTWAGVPKGRQRPTWVEAQQRARRRLCRQSVHGSAVYAQRARIL